jgi:PKD repeat protein
MTMFRVAHCCCYVLLALMLSGAVQAASVTRGPYLQLQTETTITVRWRTDVSTDSVVRYGLAPGNLDQSVQVAGLRTNHSVALSGLATGQKYYYSVGDSIAAIAGDASYHFHTAPAVGVPADTRFWVLGDSGTANNDARAVRDAYAAWAGSDPADFWLMLGDNAYNDGTDAEYQAAVFNIYPETLRQLPLWPTLGNHDGHTADSATQTGPYYDIFTLPTAAEAGGWPSGTEAYYSFDYANIHFVNLDSYDSSRSANGAMMQWLQADLATNSQPWVIAFWHHPPYTKGSHNSDTESGLAEMRMNALPLLEAWGVDLVMTGHSHTYERSYLIDGHYGNSGTWNTATHALDPGNGRPAGTGAYEKPDQVAAQNQGAVYAVAGSSGKVSTGYPLDHPAMFVSLEKLGSMVIDVSGNQLDAVFLDDAGTVQDSFSIVKTPDNDAPLITAARAEDANHVVVDFNEPLNSTEAGDASNYTIGGLSIASAALLGDNRSVRLATSTMVDGTSYTLAVSHVRDLIGNVIVPGSTVSFDYFNILEQSFQDGIAPAPSYAGTRDSYLRQASPTSNYGAASSLQVDGDEPAGTGTDMNILLAWDTSAIPGNAIVEAAEIELEVTNASAGAYTCFGLQRAWNEAQVTWNQAASGIAWGLPGAAAASDRDSTPLCSVTAGAIGSLTVALNAAGIARVQSWINNPGSNHGLVISDPATTDGADFHSSESATAIARPRLNVLYRVDEPPPPPAYIDQFAQADVFTDGGNSGGYLATHSDNGVSQALTERESGGPKNQRYSYLVHTWQFSVAAGSSARLYANTWSGGSSDGDGFRFAWSSDNNQFQELFTVSATDTQTTGVKSAIVPASGTVYIRVTDTNQQAGNKALDTLYIDHLYIRTENGVPPANQAPTANFNSVCNGLVCQFSDTSGDSDGSIVGWAWTFGDGASSGTQDPGHTYAAAGTYSAQLTVTDDDGATGITSKDVSVSVASAINLSATGYKNKSINTASLSWSGALGAEVRIFRDGTQVAITANDGTHIDSTGDKGSRSYLYKVCEALPSTQCSNEVGLAF